MGNSPPVPKNNKTLVVERFRSVPSAETFNNLRRWAEKNGRVVVVIVGTRKIPPTRQQAKEYLDRPAGIYVH